MMEGTEGRPRQHGVDVTDVLHSWSGGLIACLTWLDSEVSTL